MIETHMVVCFPPTSFLDGKKLFRMELYHDNVSMLLYDDMDTSHVTFNIINAGYLYRYSMRYVECLI